MRCGAVRVRSIEALIDLGHAASILLPDRLPTGSRVALLTASGGFGILRAATADGQTSDGAAFVVEITAPGQTARELWRRTLDPTNRAVNAGPQSLDLVLPPWPDATLVLRTESAPSGRFNRAWSYWSDLKLGLR